jgi:predicted phosphodiesterase
MDYKFRSNSTILLGDTHSLATTYDILNLDIPNGYDVVHLGDIGLGFGDIKYAVHSTLAWLNRVDELCGKIDVKLYLIRGNHDATYESIWSSNYNNIILVKDQAYVSFPNGKRVMMIGGGISVDRCIRRVSFDYWSDEQTPFLERVENADIIFSHDAPEHFNHSTKNLDRHFKWAIEKDSLLIEDCLKQRNNISDIVFRAGAKCIFSGHFHNSIRDERDGVYYRCLDINETFEFDANKQYKL